MARNITMKDVAVVAGVHQTTVSLALRKHRSIPPATQERIRAIAEELGYRPNPMVSALMAQRKKGAMPDEGGMLAFLTAYSHPDEWRRSENYSMVFREMELRAFQLGYRIEPFWLRDEKITPERARKILLSRGIRAVIVCPLPETRTTLDFDFSGFAAVALGHTLHSPQLDSIAVDYHTMMQLALENLSSLGCKRIGFAITTTTDQRVNHLSVGAYLAWRLDHPLQALMPLRHPQWKEEELSRWVQEKQLDALITASRGEYRFAKNCLASLPNPPRVISLDTSHASRDEGIVQNLKAEAVAAIDLVTSRAEHGEFGAPESPRTILVPGYWRPSR